MSGDGFLSRWSRLKRDEARKPEPPGQERPGGEAPGEAEAPGAPDPGPMPDLPSLDEITAQTDMAVFRHPAVPDSLRQAALRKLWSADPAIRDFISPAVDYAWDWNTPGGVPGNGVLGRVDDVTRMLAQVVDGFDRPEAPPADAPRPEPSAQDTEPAPAEGPAAPDALPAEQPPAMVAAGPGSAVPEPAVRTVEPAEPRRRRHGGAVPL